MLKFSFLIMRVTTQKLIPSISIIYGSLSLISAVILIFGTVNPSNSSLQQTQHRNPLDWRITDMNQPGASPRLYSLNTDKDGSIIAARLAGAQFGVSNTRYLYYNFSRKADASYFSDVASYVSNLYLAATLTDQASLLELSDGPVVVSSVHRLGLYVAEALHAPLLLGQTIAFADSWQQACNASQETVVLAGWDANYDGLWLWLKPSSAKGVPEAQREQLKLASELVIVGSTDSDQYEGILQCSDLGLSGGKIYIHSSLKSIALSQKTWKVSQLYYQMLTYLGPIDSVPPYQWEWGLPTQTVQAYRDVWAALGKDANKVTVLQDSVVSQFIATTRVWKKYLDKNNVTARGLSIYSYWIASPAMDRVDHTLPVPSYCFYKPGFTLIFDAARAAIEPIISKFTAEQTARHTRFFVNNIGSDTDVPDGVNLFLDATGLRDFNLTIVVGSDVPEVACKSLQGKAMPCANEQAQKVLSNYARCPFGTYPFSGGSHCCGSNRQSDGSPIEYSSESCSYSVTDCPGGAIDGRCTIRWSPLTVTDIKNAISGCLSCPSGTFAYLKGGYCCREKLDCNGAPIRFTSNCCKDNNYQQCPGGGKQCCAAGI